MNLLGHPFSVVDGPSFFESYLEIFHAAIYNFRAETPVPRIIDCGSNCGVSIVYLKNLYPHAIITGIEADPRIYRLLKRNCAHLGNVNILNRAVAGKHGTLTFYADGSDGGRIHSMDGHKGASTVEAITLDELIDGPVDFLKVDIEGAEGEALAACTKLNQVRHLFLEYHSFSDSPQELGTILAKLSACGFRYFIRHQMCSVTPFTNPKVNNGMDLQLNIFAIRSDQIQR